MNVLNSIEWPTAGKRKIAAHDRRKVGPDSDSNLPGLAAVGRRIEFRANFNRLLLAAAVDEQLYGASPVFWTRALKSDWIEKRHTIERPECDRRLSDRRDPQG